MSISEREKEFLKRLKATFRIEAEEHIKAISSGLLALEKEPGQEEQTQIIETIFRQVHSLKGSARAVDITSIETICQLLESIFKEFKYKGIPFSAELFDILQRAIDTIDRITQDEGQDKEVNISGILQELETVKSGKLPTPTKPTQAAKPKDRPVQAGGKKRFTRQGYLGSLQMKTGSAERPEPQEHPEPPERKSSLSTTLRVTSEKLDNLLLQAEEMIFMKLAVNRRLSELKEMTPLFEDVQKKQAAIAPLLKSLKKYLSENGKEWEKLLEYFEYSDTRFKEVWSGLNRVSWALQQDQRIFSGMINTHLEDMRKTLMLPFATLTEGFPRMVRDLARQKGKEIEFQIKGQEIEIDKRILEEMKDPLIHLVRNAIDHGAETPAERIKKKKPAKALVEVIIRQHEGNKVEIVVADDGIGLDVEKIKTKALSSGLYTTEEIERLTPQEILSLIFHAEFSTSPIITALSGRGLGLAIVREKVEKLGGQIALDSIPGKGTGFRILLQATLATFRGILVESAKQEFIIPTLNVQQVLRIKALDIKTIGNRETVKVGDDILSYVRLDELLGLPGQQPAPEPAESVQVVVLAAGDRKIAFQVDQVLNEEEVLVKELGKQLSRVKNIAGATVLGSGAVVPILNVVDLLKSAVAAAARGRPPAPTKARPTETKPRQKSILVVEDSITSRMLLKNILETAGYLVEVAVDGMNGWITLKEKQFDLAVLDVDMPGMSGFELTEKIRQDTNLHQLPVVLVTALESRQDREKGIDVGADAYIVKSSFDQSNLLDVVKKLI